MKKLKTYVLMLSKTFPATHTLAGEETGFAPKMMAAINGMPCFHKKLHTIRGNYELWQQRFNKIMAGEAVLSVREWVGKPYGKGSTVRELALLTHEDGIGIQKLEFKEIRKDFIAATIDGKPWPREIIANNDGLSLQDWREWFKGYDQGKPMAIIHFTNFRY